MGHDGTMTLVKAGTSLWQAAKLSEEFSKRLATERFEQSEKTKTGYASITPKFAQDLGYESPFFAKDKKYLEQFVQQCKDIATNDAGLTNCAVSITFPINEQAKKMAE